MQYFYFREGYRFARRAYLRAMVQLSLLKATRVIALSEATKEAIVKRTGISAQKVSVVYHGVSDALREGQRGACYEEGCSTLQALTHGTPYVLSVSSFYAYKNLPRLLEAFALVKRTRNIPHRLVVVGGSASANRVGREALQDLANELGIADAVVFAGVVEHRLLAAFYMNAAVAVMPSLHETFGLPILEAMSCGCPMVTSQIGTMAEIAGCAGVLVDPHSVRSIALGIERVLVDGGFRGDVIARGLRAAKAFTREAQARSYLCVIEDALNS
jgi:glycosyltransferase involved in cell wall biosynthesis